MNEIKKEEIIYQIMDAEIDNLSDDTSSYFVNLARALFKMEEDKIIETGGYGSLHQYTMGEKPFSHDTSSELRLIYEAFGSVVDEGTKSEKNLGKHVLNAVGWSKTKILRKAKSKYSKALDRGILTLREIIYFGSLYSKSNLSSELERYDGPELWGRTYCKIYHPDILETYQSINELYALATSRAAIDIYYFFDLPLVEKLSDKIIDLLYSEEPNQLIDEKIAIKLFENLRKLEKNLSGFFNFEPLSSILDLDVVTSNYNRLLWRTIDIKPSYDPKKKIWDLIPELISRDSREAENIGGFGSENFARILKVEPRVVGKWIEEDNIDLLNEYTAEDGNFINILQLLEALLQAGNNKQKKIEISPQVKLKENEKVIWFSLKDLVKGQLIKEIESLELDDLNVSRQEAIHLIETYMESIEEQGIVHPYLMAAKTLLDIASESKEIRPIMHRGQFKDST